ncbi:hypothetical protein J2848_003872 [Azospirillum lipoferum]|uniref:Uncharacterized protein n=1 Tax=Azospirillum lipoferum TaxID=193 RepID=A0A5A9G137_AZOLI|nr:MULTISPECIES: hypothetical protein [Azospirillum]KAA0587967.1 hypothetical protein FZ942_33710 [Azospirillum lipoferum]MCP1612192.1 hypothetical protein [Azospirillum lipoferum]MDW5536586.1 hypothetical protein [Azospirillum sp. NL1]
MAIDATTIDSSTVQRPVPREKVSPVVSDGHNGGPVEIQGDMSFWDFLDIINPLQHIPIVSTIYREITGDTIQPSMRIMGDMLYGGVIGGMASIANAVVEQATGKDVGDTVMASLGFGGGDHPATTTAVADVSGGAGASGSPAEPQQPTGGLAAALAAAKPAGLASAPSTAATATGQPIRLMAASPPASPSAAKATASSADASPALTAQLAAGATPHPSRMPARDTPLANSALAKHAAPRYAAPAPGAVTATARSAGATAANGGQSQPGTGQLGTGQPVAAQPGDAAPAAGPAPVTPDMLSETMMRNLAKYEQSRKAAQTATSTTRVSG